MPLATTVFGRLKKDFLSDIMGCTRDLALRLNLAYVSSSLIKQQTAALGAILRISERNFDQVNVLPDSFGTACVDVFLSQRTEWLDTK